MRRKEQRKYTKKIQGSNPFPKSGTYDSKTNTIVDLDKETLPEDLEGMKGLDFRYVNITDESLCKIASALWNNKSIESLYFIDQKLDDNFSKLLFKALENNLSVKRIILERTELSKNNWSALAALSNLSYLRINKCRLGSNSLAFAEGLSNNTSLKSLELRASGVGEAGGLAIAQALMKEKKTQLRLVKLDLANNNMGDKACIEIMKACKFLQTLKEIDLSCNGITEEKLILELLDKCPGVERFPIEYKLGRSNKFRSEVVEITQVNNTKYLRSQYIFIFYVLMSNKNRIMEALLPELRRYIMEKFIRVDFKNINQFIEQYECKNKSYPQPLDRYRTETGICFTYSNERDAIDAFAFVPDQLREEYSNVPQSVKRDKKTINICTGVYTSHKATVAIECESQRNAKKMLPLFFNNTLGVHLGTNKSTNFNKESTIYCENLGIFKAAPALEEKPRPEEKSNEEKCALQ